MVVSADLALCQLMEQPLALLVQRLHLGDLAAQIAALQDQVAQIASLSQHAEELAGTLPASAARQHRAAETVTERTRIISEGVRQLRAVMASPES